MVGVIAFYDDYLKTPTEPHISLVFAFVFLHYKVYHQHNKIENRNQKKAMR